MYFIGRGLNSALFGIAITNGVYYYWYETIRGYFEGGDKKQALSTVQTLLSGALAGAATAVLTNPIWVVNTRLTARKRSLDDEASGDGKAATKPPNALQTALTMLKEDGILSFFQGILPALILVVNPTIQYFVFEKLKEQQMTRKQGKLNDLEATGMCLHWFMGY